MSITRLALLSTAIVAVSSTAVSAQDGTRGRFLSPDETRQCLCMEARVDELRSGQQPIDSLEAEYKRVDELVARARPHVDTADEAEVDSFRRMFARREALRRQLQVERGRSELAGLVSRYNALCAGQRMFKVNVDAIRADPEACLKAP